VVLVVLAVAVLVMLELEAVEKRVVLLQLEHLVVEHITETLVAQAQLLLKDAVVVVVLEQSVLMVLETILVLAVLV
jgi:hypothetical protein